MVSVNVSQLLLLGPGAVREFDFSEPIRDLAGELHLHGPVIGHARLTRTSEGIVVHSQHSAFVILECARCLEEAPAEIEGEFAEEFLPSIDLKTGLPAEVPAIPDLPLIDEHHEINLDEILRQNILTNLPLRPLCDAACPDTRVDERQEVQSNSASPFARLAVLFKDDRER
jgi:uncharacterized protein